MVVEMMTVMLRIFPVEEEDAFAMNQHFTLPHLNTVVCIGRIIASYSGPAVINNKRP